MSLVLLTSCIGQTLSQDDLFPPTVGTFLRTDGPATNPDTLLDQASYGGDQGTVLLQIKRVGQENMDEAIGKLPLGATDAGPDPALGQRKGVFFIYNGQFHAAWGNGDYLFILSAGSPETRNAFLAGYGY